MKQYLDIVKNVLENGTMKGNRTGTRALTTFCEIFRHNMADGFPLLTSKKMPIKTMLVELEGFIKGITDKGWYQERKCRIWDEWANPKVVDQMMIEWQNNNCSKYKNFKDCVNDSDKLRKNFQLEAKDLGPIYGYQWRKFGLQYGEVDWVSDDYANGLNYGVDQLKNIIHTLKTNPDDRRMVCSAWNPSQIHRMALPPCHYAFTLVHINGKLNLCWKQRSCDLKLGIPLNIASYATLLLLLCKEANLVPGELVGILEDCHIYENHIEGAKLQLSRPTHPLPKLIVSKKEKFSIFDWEYTDATLEGYISEDKIAFEVAI